MSNNYSINNYMFAPTNSPHYIYTQKNFYPSSNSKNSPSSGSNKSNNFIEKNDYSSGVKEVPIKEEDIDYLQKFNINNKINVPKKIQHFPFYHSVPQRNNRPISGRITHPRKTNGFSLSNNQNSFEFKYYNNDCLNKRNSSGEKIANKNNTKQTQSKYSSVSENKYHFIKKFAGNQLRVPYFTENNISAMTNKQLDSNREFKNKKNNNPLINTANFGQKIYPYDKINNHDYTNQKNKESRSVNSKTNTNNIYNTINSSKLQNNIQLVRIGQDKSPHNNNINNMQNELINNNNKININYYLSPQKDILEYYPINDITQNYQNYNNNQRYTDGKYKYIKNNLNNYFKEISPPQTNTINQTNYKVAAVTKLSSSSVNYLINNNSTTNNINNKPTNQINQISQIENHQGTFNSYENINKINNNQYLNINDININENNYIQTTTPPNIINSPHVINNNIHNLHNLDNNNYIADTNNNLGDHNLNLLIKENTNYNYDTSYHKPESERYTTTNCDTNTSNNIIDQNNHNDNNNYDLFYNDFNSSSSGYIKNYGYLTHPGKDLFGMQKTNQDSFICKTNINNIKDFNIFGVLDGHGPDGHFVSEYVSEFIPSQIVDHPKIKNLSEPEKIYLKLKENNCKLINEAFREADKQLKNFEFDTMESGSTCCLVIHIGKHIICANTGDSRAIVVYDISNDSNPKNIDYLSTIQLSIDYKPELPEETNRIILAGGVVEQMKDEFGVGIGPFRVWIRGKDYPGLAMSRSIGDQNGKKVGVIPDPGIMEYTLNKSTKFIIACSDGVWEFLNNETVMNIGKKFYLKNDASSFCRELISKSTIEWEKNDKTVDDITAVAAFF